LIELQLQAPVMGWLLNFAVLSRAR